MDGFIKPASAVGVLLVVMLTMFGPLLRPGAILAPLDISASFYEPWASESGALRPHNHNPSDAVTQYIPYRQLAEQGFREDGYIGWNPYGMGGISLAANTMALPATPSIHLHRWLPFHVAWNLGIVLEFFVAGLGMLVFLRTRGLFWGACIVGAVVYMMNTQFVVWVYHRWALASFCWMPWVLWAAADWTGWGDWAWRRLLAPVFLALALHGGTIQHMVFVFLATACLALAAVPDWRRPGSAWRLLAGWAVFWLLATAITAHTLVPQVQAYLVNIGVGHTRGGIGYPQGTFQPVLNVFFLFGQVWPWLGGDPQTIDAWRALHSAFMAVAYLGTVPMVLAIFGIFRREAPLAARLLVLGGLLIPLTPLVGPLYHRVQLLFLLGGAWMAAEILASLLRRPNPWMPRLFSAGVAILAAALLVAALIPAAQQEALREKAVRTAVQGAQSSQFGGDSEWVAARASKWVDRIHIGHPRTLGLVLLLGVGAAGLFLVNRGGLSGRAGVAAIALACFSELGLFYSGWRTISESSFLAERHPHLEGVAAVVGAGRLLQADSSRDRIEVAPFLPPNQFQPFGVRILGGYESIHSKSVWRTVAGDLPPEEALTLAGVTASLESRAGQPAAGTSSWPVAADFPRHVLRKNPSPLPPILAGTGPTPNTLQELLPGLRAARELIPRSKTMSARTLLVPDGIRWIRFDENHHPGWFFRLNEESSWVPLSKGVDGALWLDFGEPKQPPVSVEIRFRPKSGFPSLLSWSALCITGSWFIIAFLPFRKRRKEANE